MGNSVGTMTLTESSFIIPLTSITTFNKGAVMAPSIFGMIDNKGHGLGRVSHLPGTDLFQILRHQFFSHMLEPFFTTKEERGTGMILAIVY